VKLKDGGAAADGGRDGHVSDHILLRAAREPGENAADGLNAVLRVAGETYDGIAESRR
jgi:hypothetical protein